MVNTCLYVYHSIEHNNLLISGLVNGGLVHLSFANYITKSSFWKLLSSACDIAFAYALLCFVRLPELPFCLPKTSYLCCEVQYTVALQIISDGEFKSKNLRPEPSAHVTCKLLN